LLPAHPIRVVCRIRESATDTPPNQYLNITAKITTMKITIHNKPYEFKTSFAELTVNEYVQFLNVADKPLMERVATYTGIPFDVLSALQLKDFLSISEQVSYVEDAGLLEAMAEPYTGKNVAVGTYGI